MIKYNKYISFFFVGMLLVFGACEQEEYELGDIITPTDLEFDVEIVGLDAENPYGDGTGVVNFVATANDEMTFTFNWGDGQNVGVAQNGIISHQFKQTGVFTYNVTVIAVGAGGASSSKSKAITVFASFADDEAKAFLTGGSSKSWYWAANKEGHLGLGPNSVVSYDAAGHYYAAWYRAGAWEKAGTCLYDCEFVFSLDGDNLTFEQINPTGQAFFQGDNLSIVGGSEEGCYDYDFTGVKNVSFSPSNSIATIDGEYRGTTMSFSDGGFMGFYVGTSEYEIISVSENRLEVRCVSAGNTGHAWYHVFTSEKPVQ